MLLYSDQTIFFSTKGPSYIFGLSYFSNQNMAATGHESIVYVKDNVYGTVYLTVDSQGPIAISFFHDIQIKVLLGIIRPVCELEGLLPEVNLGKLCKILNSDIAGSDRMVLNKNRNINPKEEIDICSVMDSVNCKQDAFNVLEIREEFEESLDETTAKPVQFSADFALPQKGTNTCKRVGVPLQRSHLGRNTLISKPQNMLDSNKEECLLFDERAAQKSLRCRKKTICDSNKFVKNKKESNRKIGAGTLSKVKSLKESKMPKSKQRIEAKEDSNLNMKSGQPQKKGSAKWKLACQISCQYCLKVFENQQAFYDHKKTPRSEVYKCYMCAKVFPFQAHLQVHITTYHQQEKLISNLKESASCICDVCGVEVKNLFALKKHLMFHTQEYFYSCCICSKQFVEPGTLNNHMITHKSGGMIRCKCCDQLFATRAALAKHKLTSVEVKCHLCGQVFPNRTSRTQHYKVFHQNDILKCSKCTSMFSSPEELSVHMKKHNIYKKKQCKTCGKFFSRLEKHIVTHKAKAEIDESELFVCDKCPKKFTNRSSFQRHLTIHSQDKPYQCSNCPRKFADCGALRKHLRRHLSLMPYICEVCGKKCREPGNLKVHMRIHSDTKQFQCLVCPQAFNYKSSLEGHMRSRHSQNLNTASSGAQVPSMKWEYDKAESHQIYRTTRVDQGPSQLCQSNSWKLELGANQTFSSAPNIEMKQYYENRENVCMQPIYEENSINPVNLMARHTFQAHSLHVNPIDLDGVPKETYVEVPSSVSLSSAYTRGGNLINGHHHHKESSMSVTSMDVTAMNVSSLNVNMY